MIHIFQTETAQLLRALLPNRWLRWMLLTGFWLLAGFLSALHWELFLSATDPYTWWSLLRIKLALWLVWGALTPLILYLGGQADLTSVHWLRNLSKVLIWSLFITVLYLFLYALLLVINLWGTEFGSYPRMLRFVFQTHSTYYLLAFWMTVGVEQALRYYRRSHARQVEAAQLEAQLSEARLAAIQAQVHPHFLFNTLNTISSSILDGEREQAYDLTCRLSNLLRLSLERGRQQYASLADEIAFVQEYTELAAARFPDRFHARMDVPSELLAAEVPSLVLQPLVENAVTHGLTNGSGQTSVAIVAARQQDRLQIDVINSPVESSQTGTHHPTLGTGHQQLRDRLHMLYGDAAGLTVMAPSASSFQVRLNLPLVLPNSTIESHDRA